MFTHKQLGSLRHTFIARCLCLLPPAISGTCSVFVSRVFTCTYLRCSSLASVVPQPPTRPWADADIRPAAGSPPRASSQPGKRRRRKWRLLTSSVSGMSSGRGRGVAVNGWWWWCRYRLTTEPDLKAKGCLCVSLGAYCPAFCLENLAVRVR